MSREKIRSERGAAMVEFALILPLILLLLFGVIEFGRAYNVKVQLTGAAREGARVVALGGNEAASDARVVAAAPGLNSPTFGNGHTTVTQSCPPGATGDAKVTVSYPLQALTPLIPSGTITLTATGVMRCGL